MTDDTSEPTLDLSLARTAPVLDALAAPDFAAAVAARSGRALPDVTRAIADLASEAHLALILLRSLGPLPARARLLEVGAGPGVVAGILHAAGANLVAIEPLIGGFELFAAVGAELAARVPAAAVTLDRRTAAELDPARDGHFDVIFSINVLEHCRPLHPSLDALAAVLAPGGRMIHVCPNYRVPYEPHYAMPLLPLAPARTAAMRPGLADEPLWQSLNFITAGDVSRFARRAGLDLHFRPGALADLVERLAVDPALARRQGLAGRIVRLVARAGGVGWMRALPPAWLTPMVFELKRPA